MSNYYHYNQFYNQDPPDPDEDRASVEAEVNKGVREELKRYAGIDNTELGELAMALLNLYKVSDYGLSDETIARLDWEIKETLAAYQRTTRIVAYDVTYTCKELEYLEDEEE